MRLGFGTASFGRRTPTRAKLEVLEAAFEAGIRHVDTARLYGGGTAEHVVGRFARGRRDALTIVTKAGLFPPSAALAVAARARRRVAEGRRGFGVADVRASLETSLRALGTDHVDVLLLHECRPGDVTEELLAFLDEAKRLGLVRAAGTATDEASTRELLARGGPFPEVVQLAGSLVDRRPRGLSGRRTVVHSVLARDLARVAAHLGGDPARARRWSAALGVDCSRREAVAGLLLRRALDEWPDAVVLFSSRRPERVRAAAEAVAGARGAAAVDGLLDEVRASTIEAT